MSERPRVLLVEDDPPIQTLVELALDQLPIELMCCETIMGALDALQRAPARVLITDLSLPDGSGVELLELLQRQPALRGSARLIVFSAGLHPEIQARLAALDVWRMIPKPSPMQTLAEAVSDALGLSADASAEAAVVDSQSGGGQDFLDASRASCLARFPQEIEAGDRAVRQRDRRALQQLAGGLKEAMRKPGNAATAQWARALEDACDDDLSVDWVEVLRMWRKLREQMQALVGTATGPGA